MKPLFAFLIFFISFAITILCLVSVEIGANTNSPILIVLPIIISPIAFAIILILSKNPSNMKKQSQTNKGKSDTTE